MATVNAYSLVGVLQAGQPPNSSTPPRNLLSVMPSIAGFYVVSGFALPIASCADGA